MIPRKISSSSLKKSRSPTLYAYVLIFLFFPITGDETNVVSRLSEGGLEGLGGSDENVDEEMMKKMLMMKTLKMKMKMMMTKKKKRRRMDFFQSTWESHSISK